MSKQAELCKPGTIFITFTKSLSSPKFHVIDKFMYTMSWGPATVFIHICIGDNEGTKDYPLEVWKWDTEPGITISR